MELINVENVSKSFKIRFSKKKLFGWNYKQKKVLNNIDIKIAKGDFLALIGENGAGKSTLIKIMTGILTPDMGTVTINGKPIGKNKEYLNYIGIVFGQKSQLWSHLPAFETFNLHREIFKIKMTEYRYRVEKYRDLFELSEFWNQPVRELSLGQRMKCEIVASLLHGPSILFLDEPTIGFDVLAKRNLRECLKKLNTDENVSVVLTSHDSSDIDALAERTIIINSGEILIDCSKEELLQKIDLPRILTIKSNEPIYHLSFNCEKALIKKVDDFTCNIEIRNGTGNDIIAGILKDNYHNLVDISITSPSMEDVIAKIYEKNGRRK